MSMVSRTLPARDIRIMRVTDVPVRHIRNLPNRFGLKFKLISDDRPIDGSFWGEPEAGIIGDSVLARRDTPIHSLLHELCHLICMDPRRRRIASGNAGSDDREESAVCYLQVVLADLVCDVGRDRLMADMDAWGYSFRLGSTRRWFTEDADDDRSWLQRHGLLSADGSVAYRLRDS